MEHPKNQDTTRGGRCPPDPLFSFPRDAPPGPPVRADGRAGHPFPSAFVFRFLEFVWGLQALGGISCFCPLNFTSNALKIRSGTPLGLELWTYLKKRRFLERLNWVKAMVKKGVTNYIEYCSQSTTRLVFSRSYNDIMIILYHVIIICWPYM